MYRTHSCGELRQTHVGQQVVLSGWVRVARDFGAVLFLDLRDRYGVTQVVFDQAQDAALYETAKRIGREFVLRVAGLVRERSNKNPNLPTGEIEIEATHLDVLNPALTPPFTIEDDTDGGDDLRMKYRYLDLRRRPLQQNILFRSELSLAVRNYLSGEGFVEVETPVLIKSTPEGARDFVVPSRMNSGQFYALPQSPQTFKQLLMVSGFDKYFQIVKCFRDEDLRADRQPEFTQIDCEMSFVTQEDILQVFEGMTRHLFSKVLGLALPTFPRMTYDEAMKLYGSDKPDIRFGMPFVDLTELTRGSEFPVFEQAQSILGICATGAAEYTRKQLDELTDWVKRPQIGAKGLVYVRFAADGSVKSSVDKFYSEAVLKTWLEAAEAKPGDLLLVLCGDVDKTRIQLGQLRLEIGDKLGLRPKDKFAPLWVLDFPLLEWDEETARFYAMHHPFTSPKPADMAKMASDDVETLKGIRADAYDLVINGVEIGGGSIRIHNRELQAKNFSLLGFTPEEAERQFGFLLSAFEYGAPPHGGLAFGFDRLCAVMSGTNYIRDFIAFPKNNQGRDMMLDAPSEIHAHQLDELSIAVKPRPV